MRAVVIIPARFASSRYPGKPLVNLLGKPMILWVAEAAAKAVDRVDVFVATDDERIADVVEGAGFQTVMTSETCLTGTDRLAEAATYINADVFVNVQGDEPLVNPADIKKAVSLKFANIDSVINGFTWLASDESPTNVNLPKVITNEQGEMIYMSRSAIPGFKDAKNAPSRYKKQVCIYAFTSEELLSFKNFGRKSELESHEDIEILRFIELNKKIQMFETTPGSLAVDVPEDVAAVESEMKRLFAG